MVYGPDKGNSPPESGEGSLANRISRGAGSWILRGRIIFRRLLNDNAPIY